MKKGFYMLYFVISFAFSKAQAPIFQWAKQFGGSGICDAFSITSDSNGNVYTAGRFSFTCDFDPNPTTFTLSAGGTTDAFVSKLSSNGSFVWAKQFTGVWYTGPSPKAQSTAIKLDAIGNMYVAGEFYETIDFDPGPGTYTLNAPINWNTFIVKLDPNGNFIWAKQMAGQENYANSIAVDGPGNVYSTGKFNFGCDFDPGVSSYTLTSGGLYSDIFVSKLDPNGNFIWAKQIGSPLEDYGRSIIIDASGNICISGAFSGNADFDPSVSNTYTLNAFGNSDAFILKVDSSGNFIWVKQFGGNSYPYTFTDAFAVVTDSLNNIFTTGYFNYFADFDPGSGVFNLFGGSSGDSDIFISKLDSLGNFVWAKNFGGGSGRGLGYGIALDASGTVYTTGGFEGTLDFDPDAGAYYLTGSSASNNHTMFISKLDALGGFLWAEEIGGTFAADGFGIIVESSGTVYTTGSFKGTEDFDPGPGIYNLSSANNNNGFVHKMNNVVGINEYLLPQKNNFISPNPTSSSFNLTLNSSSQIIISNVLGQEILNKNLDSGKQTIDIGDQANGIYFVKLISEGKQEVVKVVKE